MAALAAQVRPASGGAEPPRLPLLAEAELKSFVETGYLVVHAGFSDEWHKSIGEQAEALSRAHAAADPPVTGSDHQDGIWGPLTPRMQAIITCPALQSALISILGEDFVVGGGAHMHVSSNSGQQYHKDGTPVAIKAHEPRGVIMMYYPNGASIDMGPTAVCPGSMYFGRDMRGAPDLSEQHDVHLNTKVNGTRGGGNDDPSTLAIDAIGLPPDSQRIITVAPGAILVAHEHLFHRGTASCPGAQYRPAFKMSARRVSEPRSRSKQGLSSTTEQAPFGHTGAPVATQAIYEASLAWLCGSSVFQRDVPVIAPSEAVKILRTSSSEVERTGAAYCLARAEYGIAGADALLSCAQIQAHGVDSDSNGDDAVSECVQRAAFYGLRAVLTGSRCAAARARVVAALMPILREKFHGNEGSVCGTAAVLFVLGAAAPITGVNGNLAVVDPDSELGSQLSDDLLLSAVIEWIQRTRLELGKGLQEAREEGHNVPQAVEDRRRAMVEACYALSHTAMSALSCGKTQSVLLAAGTLLQLATDGGMHGGEVVSTVDGGSSGNKCHAKSVAHSAAMALLQLCSCSPSPVAHGSDEEHAAIEHCTTLAGLACSNSARERGSSSMYRGKMSWPVGWQGNDASVVTAAETVGEGLRRLRNASREQRSKLSKLAFDDPVASTRRKLFLWLEAQCASRGPAWCGMGKWAYVECHEKAKELGHDWAGGNEST